jgi:transglutaminase-like putative cysteine protease
MKYRVIHRTSYEYSEPVTVSQHAARLQPALSSQQAVPEFALDVFPQAERMTQRRDYFGNSLAVFSVRERHTRLEVTARSLVEVRSSTSPALMLSPVWSEVAQRFRDPVNPRDAAVYEFRLDSPLIALSAQMAEWTRQSFGFSTPLLSGVRDLMGRLYDEFAFDPQATEVATPLEEVWEKRRGVCQDFAHIGIACLRSLGIPARYVSGYIRTIPPPGQERLAGADASHAWLSVFCPVHGWVDFDPTNDLIVGEDHLRVAVGRDYSDVSPLSGVLTGGGKHTVHVEVDVVPVE